MFIDLVFNIVPAVDGSHFIPSNNARSLPNLLAEEPNKADEDIEQENHEDPGIKIVFGVVNIETLIGHSCISNICEVLKAKKETNETEPSK